MNEARGIEVYLSDINTDEFKETTMLKFINGECFLIFPEFHVRLIKNPYQENIAYLIDEDYLRLKLNTSHNFIGQ